jgi:predicted cobalt transporter CbtA
MPNREPSGRRVPVWWIAAVVVLALGFADLARGGETLAPILLVIGYCILVPVAILR